MFEGEKSTHAIYGIVLAVIAIVALGGIVYMVSSADDTVDQSVTVGTSAPTIGTVTVESGADCATGTILNATDSKFTLTEAGTSHTVHVCGTVTDLNGYEEVNDPTDYDVTLYDDTPEDFPCAADDNDCYEQIVGEGLTLSNCTSGTTCDFDFEIADIAYLANPSSAWKARVNVVDDASQAGDQTSSAFGINSLTAFSITNGPVNFGTVALGGDSAQQTITFNNYGNVIVDAEQTASGAMTCTVGSIPVGNVEWSFTNAFEYGAGTDMTAGATSITTMSLAKSTVTGTPETKPMYLKLHIPTTGVGGSCMNTVTFTAVANG